MPFRTPIAHPFGRRSGRRFAALLALALTVLAAACSGAPAGGTPTPTPLALGAPVTLAPDQAVTVGDAGWRLRFVAAENDSRCPVGVQCIRAGDVTLRFVATDPAGATSDVSARFGEGAAPTAFGPLTLEVLGVQPAPAAGQSIASADYRVTLTVR